MNTFALDSVASRVVELSTTALPDEVVHETRRCFLNVLGTALGAGATPEIDGLFRAAKVLGGSEVKVLGREESVDRYFGASALGFAAHFDDFDDTHLETVIHPGAATMGSLYALGLCEEVAPREALMAMALGVEVQLRIGLAMTPSHYDLGWHITGTCGVLGAAVCAGLVLDLGASGLANALGIATTMSLGQREAFGTPIKPYHAGKAASNGILAAMLARSGVVVTEDMLTDPNGYFALLSEAWTSEWIEPADLGRRWTILDNTYKPFPCGIVAHPAIEAATKLHAEFERIDPAEVGSVTVACNPLVVELMGRTTASTGLEARFCAIHGVAVGLLFGRAGLHEFSDTLATDPRVVALRDRTKLVPDEHHGRQAATVTVHLVDETTLEFQVLEASGSKERPLTDAQLEEKFTALVEPRFPGRSAVLVDAVMHFGDDVGIDTIDQLVHTR